jgi:hypothetical protein
MKKGTRSSHNRPAITTLVRLFEAFSTYDIFNRHCTSRCQMHQEVGARERHHRTDAHDSPSRLPCHHQTNSPKCRNDPLNSHRICVAHKAGNFQRRSRCQSGLTSISCQVPSNPLRVWAPASLNWYGDPISMSRIVVVV